MNIYQIKIEDKTNQNNKINKKDNLDSREIRHNNKKNKINNNRININKIVMMNMKKNIIFLNYIVNIYNKDQINHKEIIKNTNMEFKIIIKKIEIQKEQKNILNQIGQNIKTNLVVIKKNKNLFIINLIILMMIIIE